MIEKLYIFLISVVIAIVLDAVWEVFINNILNQKNN